MKFELFGKLKKHNAPPAPQHITTRDVPFERASELAASGMSEADIIKTLKDSGYSFREIDEALNRAVKTGVSEQGYGAEPSAHQDAGYAQAPPAFSGENFVPEPQPSFAQAPGYAPQAATGVSAEELEEIVDAISEEKIQDLKSVAEKSESSVRDIADKLKGLSGALDAAKAHTEEISANTERKLGEITAKLEELEPKILGLERAFKDIMPNLVDSVREVKEAMHSMRERTGNAEREDALEDESEDAEKEFMVRGPQKKFAEGTDRRSNEKSRDVHGNFRRA